MRHRKTLAPVLLIVLFGTLIVQLPLAIAARASDYEWFEPILQVRSIITSRFVEPDRIDEKQMQLLMIDAMLATLDDPHTQYVPPADEDDFNKVLRGRYVGIGAEVDIQDDYLRIVSPMDDSPALEAGVLAGDIVLEIEGESTLRMPVSECIERLTGEPNTPVTITVRHLDGTEEEITIERRQIVTRTIKGLRRVGEEWSYCLNEDLGLDYVRVTQFNDASARDLRRVLDELNADGLNGLVLDLRDNLGGSLAAAIKMTDIFLDEGVIVSVRDRNGEGPTFRAQRQDTLPYFPMVVLVNDNSASASEIVAGALQDNGRARVLGVRTYGKGSVQEVRGLEYNAGTLKYTTAYYYLPSGRNLNRSPDSEVWGVDPNPGLVVPVSDEEYIEKIRARREFEAIRELSPDEQLCGSVEWIRESLKDEQLAAALDVLQTRVNSGDWISVTDEDTSAVAFDQQLQRASEHRARVLAQLESIDQRIAELQDLAHVAGSDPLLPEDADLTDASIILRDQQGNVIGAFRLEGGDLAAALRTLTLERVSDAE